MKKPSWIKWAVFEGATKTVSKGLSKFIGVTAMSLPGVALSTLVIGVLQGFGGLVGAKLKKQALLVTPKEILIGIIFGLLATTMSIIGKYTFVYPDADVGVVTFLITLSVIPGAIVDTLIYKDRLRARNWVGIGMFLVAGYAILGFPELKDLLQLPTWVWLSLVIAALAVVNETITRHVRKMHPMPYNFWIGLTTVIATALFLSVIDGWGFAEELPTIFWVAAAAIGLNVLAMITFKLLAYKAGGTIALKKVVMLGFYLVSATIFGVVAFHEPITIGKVIGIIGFLVAFAMTDEKTWEGVQKRIHRR